MPRDHYRFREPDAPQEGCLKMCAYRRGPIWEKIVEKNGLQKFRFEEIAAWGYPDGVFASDYDIVSDTSKARRFGFHDLVDTEEMFLRMFSDFRRERIIP
jgi:hypothetical protein